MAALFLTFALSLVGGVALGIWLADAVARKCWRTNGYCPTCDRPRRSPRYEVSEDFKERMSSRKEAS